MKAEKWLEVLQASKRQSTHPQRFNGAKVIIERYHWFRLLFAVHLRLTVRETLRSMPSSGGECSSVIRVFTDSPFSLNRNCLISINVSMWNKLSDNNKKSHCLLTFFMNVSPSNDKRQTCKGQEQLIAWTSLPFAVKVVLNLCKMKRSFKTPIWDLWISQGIFFQVIKVLFLI